MRSREEIEEDAGRTPYSKQEREYFVDKLILEVLLDIRDGL